MDEDDPMLEIFNNISNPINDQHQKENKENVFDLFAQTKKINKNAISDNQTPNNKLEQESESEEEQKNSLNKSPFIQQDPPLQNENLIQNSNDNNNNVQNFLNKKTKPEREMEIPPPVSNEHSNLNTERKRRQQREKEYLFSVSDNTRTIEGRGIIEKIKYE